MTSHGCSLRYNLRSQRFSQAIIKNSNTAEKVPVLQSTQPLLEAFQIGAWWDIKIMEKRETKYLIHFEGFDRHEEQEVLPTLTRLRSRKARDSDCSRLKPGADIVVFVIHPHASRSGSNLSRLSAWYDVRIISKEHKHDVCACACKFRVQLYDGCLNDIEMQKKRHLLTDTSMEVPIGKISILQVSIKTAFKTMLGEALALPKSSAKKQWSNDTYILEYHVDSTVIEEDTVTPLADLTTIIKEDIGTPLVEANTRTHLIDLTTIIEADTGTPLVETNTGKPLVDLTEIIEEDTGIPLAEENTGKPLVDITTMEEDIGIPLVKADTGLPLVDRTMDQCDLAMSLNEVNITSGSEHEEPPETIHELSKGSCSFDESFLVDGVTEDDHVIWPSQDDEVREADASDHQKSRKRTRQSLPRMAKVYEEGMYAENQRYLKHARMSKSDEEEWSSDETSDSSLEMRENGMDDVEIQFNETSYSSDERSNIDSSTEFFLGSHDANEEDDNLTSCCMKRNVTEWCEVEENSGYDGDDNQTPADCSHAVACQVCISLEEKEATARKSVQNSNNLHMPDSGQGESSNSAYESAQSGSVKLPGRNNSSFMSRRDQIHRDVIDLCYEGDMGEVASILKVDREQKKLLSKQLFWEQGQVPPPRGQGSLHEEQCKCESSQQGTLKKMQSRHTLQPQEASLEGGRKPTLREGKNKVNDLHKDESKARQEKRYMLPPEVASSHGRNQPKASRMTGQKGELDGLHHKQKLRTKHSQQEALDKQQGKPRRSGLHPKTATPDGSKKPNFSREREGKKEFDDLFERIIRSARELRSTKGIISPEQPVPATQERPDQVPWDPIIFHEKGDTDAVLETTKEECDPLRGIWQDMELAFEEMHTGEMEATLSQQDYPPCEDIAFNCGHHHLMLDEEEGHVCFHCGLVVTSIENIFSPLKENKVHHSNHGEKIDKEVNAFVDRCEDSKEHPVILKRPVTRDVASVWSLIPELKASMRKHQIDGFEFLWKNIGGSSSQDGDSNGGCIISHAPGTGKSLLVISFLKSFLILNSWCRPLIVAPKNMLLPWQREFQKWNADIHVHLLRASNPKSTLNYLKMISEWQNSTSVLIVTYQLFSRLTDQEIACKIPEYHKIGRLLLYIPDILVLDEGHVPRNGSSKLRKSVLQVRTRLRILVSGTLFQNNVQELFNSLYLARPNFLNALERPFNKRLQGFNMEDAKQWQVFEDFEGEQERRKTEELAEARSRKIFMEEIGNKLEMSVEENGGDEFKGGIKKFRAITVSFLHCYGGEILNTLPGIKEFIVLLQATPLQVSLLDKIRSNLTGVEKEHIETSISIHPSLLLECKITRNCASIDFNELRALRKDPLQGGKVKFIVDLANCCQSTNEKLLIFSQFIAPLELVGGMLQGKFKVLMMKGKGPMEERQRIMDNFNEAKDATLILLASLTACGEGINLTGASRVVFLDMHWNPARMKQAVSRAFRIGQKKVVYTYRLMVSVEKEAEKYMRIQKKDRLSRSIFTSGTKEIAQGKQKEGSSTVTGEDIILDRLLSNDASKCICKVVKHSAELEQGKLLALLEQYNS